mmetsp:Transcript_37667/g.102285  ORF Transcript_37667/g.102285 Transcript_37667/m.102285 type:complete len:760 (+) Transcript_37667:403-2682(+)
MPCFKGKMWSGQSCCTDRLDGDLKAPNFDDLKLGPKKGCNSGTAQLIAQGMCRGQANCTIPINTQPNYTYTWLESERTPCVSNSKRHKYMVQVVDTDATAAQPPAPPPPPVGSNVGDLELPKAKVFWTNISMCTASLMEPGPNADFSACPELPSADYVPFSTSWPDQNAAKRNLIVKATCYSPTFKVPWYQDGAEQQRTKFSEMASFADCAITLILFWLFLWLMGQEKKACEEADGGNCSAADYTFRLRKIPRHTDLDELESQLKAHFESVLNKEKVVVYDKPIKVIDINFGLSSPTSMAAKVKRGVIARKVDLLDEELNMMRHRKAKQKLIDKKEKKAEKAREKFKKACELCEKTAANLKAKTAFITFNSEEGYERCARAYKSSYTRRVFGQPRHLRFPKELGGGNVKLSVAAEPSDYIWEHFGQHPLLRAIKVSFSNAVTLILLLVSFSLIAFAKGQEAKIGGMMGNADCSVYKVKDNPQPNGFDTAWSGRYKLNTTSDGYEVLTRDRVVEDIFWDYYNKTNPGETGKLNCYCSAVLAGAPVGIDPGSARVKVQQVEFLDPTTKTTYTGCTKWSENYYLLQVMDVGAVAVVIIVNSLLKIILAALVTFEKPETRTAETLTLALKLFYTTLMNVGFLFLIIGGNLEVFTMGRTFLWSRVMKEANVMSGSYSDFDVDWYQKTGTKLLHTLLLQIFIPQASKVVGLATTGMSRCWDRKCTTNMFLTRKITQLQLQALYTGPRFELESRYGQLHVVTRSDA